MCPLTLHGKFQNATATDLYGLWPNYFYNIFGWSFIKLVYRILIFAFVNFLDNFEILNNIRVYRGKNFKTLLLLQFFMD